MFSYSHVSCPNYWGIISWMDDVFCGMGKGIYSLATVWCVFLVLINFSFSLAWYNESSPVFFRKKTHNSSSQRLQTSPYNILCQIALIISSHPLCTYPDFICCVLYPTAFGNLCVLQRISTLINILPLLSNQLLEDLVQRFCFVCPPFLIPFISWHYP